MPEIGATLREARVKARIDISEIEAETKIRAKYLRALENEDWEVLPGPAYTRSFIRAYAESVGLEPTALLEMFRLQNEQAVDHDHERQLARQRRMARDRNRPNQDRGFRSPVPGRLIVAIALVILLLIAVVGLATSGGDDDPASTTTATRTAPAAGGAKTTATATPPASKPRRVSLRLIPEGAVRVCLIDATGNRRYDNVTVQPGNQPTFRSRRFYISINGPARLVVGGRRYTVPDQGVGYRVTASGRTRLAVADWPNCGA